MDWKEGEYLEVLDVFTFLALPLLLAGVLVVGVGGPESEVVAEELHNGGGVLVLLVLQVFQVSNGGVKGLLRQFARLFRRVQYLIKEHRVVQRQSQSAWVSRRQLSGLLAGLLVRLVSLLARLLVLFPSHALRQIAVVVALHLEVKDLGLGRVGLGDQVLVEEPVHVVADFLNLGLDLDFVGTEEVEELGALGLFLLLDGRDGPPRGSARSDPVLVSDAEQVALLVGQVCARLKLHPPSLPPPPPSCTSPCRRTVPPVPPASRCIYCLLYSLEISNLYGSIISSLYISTSERRLY